MQAGLTSAATDSSHPPPQGVIGLKRTGDVLTGFIQIGSGAPVSFAPSKVATGPVRIGLQMVFGSYYLASFPAVSIAYDSKLPRPSPSPSPLPSPSPSPAPAPPAMPPLRWSAGDEASWRSMFGARNNVSWDASGAATLQGNTTNPGYLAPSAGLLSLDAFDGDVAVNVSISAWRVLQ
jgi:hypothetical protein